MKPSTSLNLQSGVSVLLVGEPKSGKSSVALGFPDPGIIDCDLNLASAVRRAGPTKIFSYAQPAIKDDGTERPRTERWTYAVEQTRLLIADPKIKTIVLDGLGAFVEYLIAYITSEAEKAGASKVKAVGLDGKQIAGMEIQHYADLARLLRGYIMLVRASGKYLVVTSHQTGDKDEVTKAIRYVLAIPGQSKDTLGGCFTDVWATMASPTGVNQVKYEIRTKPTGFHVALGASFAIDGAIDITGKTPQQVWAILEPKITAK